MIALDTAVCLLFFTFCLQVSVLISSVWSEFFSGMHNMLLLCRARNIFFSWGVNGSLTGEGLLGCNPFLSGICGCFPTVYEAPGLQVRSSSFSHESHLFFLAGSF